MSEEIKHEQEHSGQETNGHKCKRKRCGKRGGCGRFLFGVLAIVGVVWLAGAAFGPGCGYAGWHHSGHHWSKMDVSKRMDHMAEHLIDRVDASDAQAQQIKAITTSYAAHLQPFRGNLLESRESFTRLLSEPEVNRIELEQIRQSAFDQLNQSSRELVQMVADIADVLTPEQRKELAEHAKSRFGHWH